MLPRYRETKTVVSQIAVQIFLRDSASCM